MSGSETEKRADRIVRRMTIRARDNSYLRSFEDTEDTTTNTRKVFGIKYRDEAAYSRYRQSYLTFITVVDAVCRLMKRNQNRACVIKRNKSEG